MRRYGLVRGMLFPPRGNHDTEPYESVGSELRHCNYVSDHLGQALCSKPTSGRGRRWETLETSLLCTWHRAQLPAVLRDDRGDPAACRRAASRRGAAELAFHTASRSGPGTPTSLRLRSPRKSPTCQT